MKPHHVLGVLLVFCSSARAETKSGIVFTISGGAENGTQAILDARKAEILEKKGGKLSGHDWWLWGLTGIDHDRDGDTDLLVTIHGPAGHGVFLKNLHKETGKLSFSNITRELGVDWQLPSAEGRRTFVWDFDGDGWPDFSGLHTPDFLNQQGKRFTLTSKKAFGSFSPQAIIDLNGDGYPDVYNAGGNNGIWDQTAKRFVVQPFVHPLKGKMPDSVQRLWLDTTEKPQNRFLRVHLHTDHDLDGDGANEIIVTGYGSYGGDTFGRYLRQQGEEYRDVTRDLGLPENGTPMLFKDLDADGHLDVLVAASPEAGFFRNDGKGRFRVQPGPVTDLLRSRDPYLHRAESADFDNDGLLDLVLSKPRSGPKVIFANVGNGDFEPLHRAKAWDSDPVVVCDLNDDGLMDVALGGPGNQVTLYVNATPRPGYGCRLYPRLPAPNAFAVGTKVEVFRAGELARPGARPTLVELAHADGTPIYVGLNEQTSFDLRVTFPGREPLLLRNVQRQDRLQITLDGITPLP